MLTLRIIDSLGGENIYQAKKLNVSPDITKLDTDRNIRNLYFETPDGDDVQLSGDYRVYVMNDSGKTVANYYLGVSVPVGTPPTGDEREQE
jgi:hypothetical protein